MSDPYDAHPIYDEDEEGVGVVHEPRIQPNKPDIIKVSAKSRSTAVAGAIAAVMRERRYAEVQAIGAGAVNQAVKALAIARTYLEQDHIDLMCTPYFKEVDIEGNERTAVRFTVEPRPGA